MQLKHTLLATALVAASATAMALPNVEVLVPANLPRVRPIPLVRSP